MLRLPCSAAPDLAIATMLPKLLQNIVETPLAWLAAGPHGDHFIFDLLDSIDRLCGQFATALQHAEQDHLFLFLALIGTLTLVFPQQN